LHPLHHQLAGKGRQLRVRMKCHLGPPLGVELWLTPVFQRNPSDERPWN
jgi:hypothetical protein